ncbi:MAG: hypothetical protein WA476_21205 [Acidobacteriaceae bacterium]
MATGKVHRARKTPSTMQNEIANGRNPDATSRAGASAAPSHAPAANAHNVPSRNRTCGAGVLRSGSGVVTDFEIKNSLRRFGCTSESEAGKQSFFGCASGCSLLLYQGVLCFCIRVFFGFVSGCSLALYQGVLGFVSGHDFHSLLKNHFFEGARL